MCVGENLLLTFLETVHLPRKIFVKLWAVHLYTVARKENWTLKKKKNLKYFLSASAKKIYCYLKFFTAFSLFSPEINSDNENWNKTILGIAADWMFPSFSYCSVFHSSLDLALPWAVPPSAIVKRQSSSDDTDNTTSSRYPCAVQVQTVRINTALSIVKY